MIQNQGTRVLSSKRLDFPTSIVSKLIALLAIIIPIGFISISSMQSANAADQITWTAQTPGMPNISPSSISSITSDFSGTKLAVTTSSGYIYTSTDSGATWTKQMSAGSRNWTGISSSSDGTKLAAIVSGGYIYTSTDSGATWSEQTSSGSRNWSDIAYSRFGDKLAAVVSGGFIFTSTDSGATWTEQSSAGSRNWTGISMNNYGNKLAAVVAGGFIYYSSNSGISWTERNFSGSRNWTDIASNEDGIIFAATTSSGYIYTSTDSGVSWKERTSVGSRNWIAIASNGRGSKLVAIASDGAILSSINFGVDWEAKTIPTINGLLSGIIFNNQGSNFAAYTNAGVIWTGIRTGLPSINIAQAWGDAVLAGGQTVEVSGYDFVDTSTVTVGGNTCTVIERIGPVSDFLGRQSSTIRCLTTAITNFGWQPAVVTSNEMSDAYYLELKTTISFNSDGGTAVGSKSYAGSPINSPSTPTFPGHSNWQFGGWFDSNNLEINWSTFSPVGPITLKAKWVVPPPPPPPVVYIPPPPQPYLSVSVAPTLHKVGTLAICTAGKYNYGVNYFDGSPNTLTKNISLNSFGYKFYLDGLEVKEFSTPSASTSISINLENLKSVGFLTCQVTVERGGVSLYASSKLNDSGVAEADLQRSVNIQKAEVIYQSALRLNSETKKKALLENHKLWRDSVDLARITFVSSKSRAKSSKEVVAASRRQSQSIANAASGYKLGIDKIENELKEANFNAARVRKDMENILNMAYWNLLESNGYGLFNLLFESRA